MSDQDARFRRLAADAAPSCTAPPSYDGDCPCCGGSDGYLNVGYEHWGVCHACRVKWWIGSNLYSGWQGEAVADWTRNAALLADYDLMVPATPPESERT